MVDNDKLPDTQNGSLQNKSEIDNIYVLNHIVNTELQKGKRVFCEFVDFKAAFDTINREILCKRLEKLCIPDYIIKAIRNIYIYKDTWSTNNGTTTQRSETRMSAEPPSRIRR